MHCETTKQPLKSCKQMKSDKEISKFMSLVLRHQPEKINVVLDENGWTDVAIFLSQMNTKGFSVDMKKLEEIISTNEKQRFALNDTKDRIRANQGHSVEIDLGLSPTEPPQILYHGTSQNAISSIKEQGITKQNRQHVHLSAQIETAINVGSRHGKVVVLTIKALEMHQNGEIFYISDNGVWLADIIETKYIDFK